jgi:hypothetical protein
MARTVKNLAQANNTITTNPNTATQTSSQANITAAQSQIQDARIHLMNSQTATQASNAPVGQISVAEIEALLAGKTLTEQVNDFRRNTYKLYRDPDLSIDDVERNGKIAEHLDSILANDTSSFARRSRRNIKRTQSFLEKKILRKELNTLNKEITDLLNSDQAITAEDLEKIVQQKEKLQKLLDKHANNFLLEKLAKNIDENLDKLFDKFLTPLRPKMQNLTDKLSKIIKSGTSISFDEHVKLQDEYDELLLKFGSLEHSEIKNFKDSADKKFSKIPIEIPIYIDDPIPLPNPIAQPLPMPINPIDGNPILIRPILTEPGQALKTSGINLVTETEVDNRGGINESTEYAFSSFKIDFYQSQKTGLENLMDEYISMDDDSGFARAEITKLRSQMNTVNSAIRFWNRRNDSWQEKSFSEDRLQVGDNAFSAFKIEFNRSQLTGLENLMDEYISMGDESDFANRKIAKLNAQINTLESVDSFWVEQNKFWREENTALYKQEDITKVQDIYKQIEEQETLVDSALNNQDLNGTINSKAKLAKLQEDLSQIRQGFKKENTPTFSFDTPQEKANANSKKEFYQSQKTGLENLMDQLAINDDSGFARAEITKLRSQMNKVNIATTFWQEQEKFFEDFSKYQFKTEDQAKVTDLMSIIKEFSNLIDQSLFKDDESGSAHSDIANLREKLYSAQSELVRLGYN